MTRLDSAVNPGAASFSERGHDLYETPPEAVLALLDAEDIPHHIWEPACGPGSIVQTLRNRGKQVLATDLIDYGCPESESSRDFLFELERPEGIEAIITNPPFKLAGEFVTRARELCPRVYMLLRLAFLESQKRTPILEAGDLARVYVFRKRLPMMHRHGWEGKKATSALAFAWFCWDRDHKGPTELYRI